MSSFKSAIYEPVEIFGHNAVYTNDRIDDNLPDNFYVYSLVLNNEQRELQNGIVPQSDGTIISKQPISLSDNPEVCETDLTFKDEEFSFESFFGIHRPIDFQINAAEDKKNEQLQSKSRSKVKSFSQEIF